MEQQKVTINELVKRLTDEMLRIGYSKQTIYRNFIPNMMHVVHFYEATGTVYYSPASSAEYLSYNIERCKRGEITDHYVRQIRSTISKMDEFFTTGTLRIRSNKHAAAVQDYILNARPASENAELFLRVNPPCYAIMDAAAIGDMFKRYERKAGIERQALDGKGFHGLRRRLAKKLLISGSPTTEIAQILGHNDVDSVRQYLSLDTANIKECALDFSGIPLSRKEFC